MTDIRVINRGALSLVQDAGRRGYQKYGVSVCGAMDQDALFLGNRVIANEPGAAALEVTLGGAEFEFLRPCIFSVTGGDLGPTLDGAPVPMWQSVAACETSRLKFSMPPISGLRAYVCVAGGIDTLPVLESRSTHAGSRLGGLQGQRLENGDTLPIGLRAEESAPGLVVPTSARPRYASDITVRVIPGPQEFVFSDAGITTFFSEPYTVSDRSDRQGARLQGPVIESRTRRYEIVSDAVVAGAVQVPGDGKPIVLLADRQTTGGYTKIGVVASVDLPLLAQAQPGTTVRFERCTVEVAQALLRRRRAELMGVPLHSAAGSPEYSLKVNGRPVRVVVAGASHSVIPGTVLLEVGGERLSVQVESET